MLHLRSYVVARAAAGALAAGALLAALTGCATTVTLTPADDANNPLCAGITVGLPGQLGGQQRRWTDAQATGAWGDPSAVILSCGVTPPGPTEEKCITIGGVDWIVDESKAPLYRVTTYGRTPAVQLLINNKVVSPNDVLSEIATLVSQLPSDAKCISTETLVPAAP